jgi:hypothetical protein
MEASFAARFYSVILLCSSFYCSKSYCLSMSLRSISCLLNSTWCYCSAVISAVCSRKALCAASRSSSFFFNSWSLSASYSAYFYAAILSFNSAAALFSSTMRASFSAIACLLASYIFACSRASNSLYRATCYLCSSFYSFTNYFYAFRFSIAFF